MAPSPNIYHAIVFDMHQKVREFLDGLNQSGQVDHDETRSPHVISVDSPNASVYRCMFMRNGRPEHFVMHTRRKVDPVKSWQEDGWSRPAPIEEPKTDDDGKRKERARQTMEQVYESIVNQILPKR